ncbi:hypothetical protein [Streptomyces triticiradicis]|uniref:hypothetical protein n=1 Tax=Streptomyces triticiradicis TaxID=2651189 RepID=UPI001788C110
MDQPDPTPAECTARKASPASMRLAGLKITSVDVSVTRMMKAMAKSAAAANASICPPLPMDDEPHIPVAAPLPAGFPRTAPISRVHPAPEPTTTPRHLTR